MRIALVKNNVVENIIIAGEGYEAPEGFDAVELEPDAPVTIGAAVTDGQIEQNDEPMQITWDMVRAKRNFLLRDSDWTQLADSPLSSGKKTEWQSYRQALRDITDEEGETEPDALDWPTPPSE